jgi:hypothetical protein
VFKRAFQGKDLLKRYEGNDKIVFIGMQTKNEAQVDREKEEGDLEWRNCRYTGHFHPSNWAFGL